MSTATELAKAEAERAEMEPDENEQAEEEEQAQEPEPEPEQEQPQGLTEMEAEREIKRLEKLAQTYLTKAVAIADKLGMPYQICPLDAFPGLAIPRQAHEVTSDVEAAVLALIGKSAPQQFPRYPGFKRCETCDGWGEVDTDAQKEISKHVMCPNPNCGGKGYVTVPLPTAPPNGAPQFPGAEIAYTPLPQGIADAWNRPAGHPHWGRDPREIGV